MILVFYVILAIIAIIAVLTLMTYISKFEINIENLDMSNIEKRKNNEKILVKISLKICNVRWAHIKLDKKKLEKLYVKTKEIEYKNQIDTKIIKEKIKHELKIILKNRKLKEQILDTKIEIEKFNANILFGTEDYVLTSYLVAFISIIISNILPHVVKKQEKEALKKINYKILPIYQPKNSYQINLSTQVSIKISNIIQSTYMIKKKNKEIKKNKKDITFLLQKTRLIGNT